MANTAKPIRTLKVSKQQAQKWLDGATQIDAAPGAVLFERAEGGYIRMSAAGAGFKLEFFAAGCNCTARG